MHPTRPIRRAEARRLPAALAAALLCFAACAPGAAAGSDSESVPPRAHAIAGGRAAWVTGDELDLVGELWADLARPITDGSSLFFAVDARTTIERTESDFTFLVRDVEYDLRGGWRGHGRRLTAFVGQRGRAFVDADGEPAVRYLAAGVEAPGWRRYPSACASAPCTLRSRFDGRIAVGPVLHERGVRADAVLFGDGRAHLFRLGGRGVAVELDLEVDGLVDDGRLRADATAGPRISFPVAGGRRASLYAHYHRSRNPLGLGQDAWLLGFAYEEGSDTPPPGVGAPEIDGILEAGLGDDRENARFLLRVLSPPFRAGSRVVFLVDANILTAEDTNELYYRYHLGLERELGGLLLGGYFYHRSNHTLTEPNDRITSINVLEAGLETPGWLGRVRPGTHGVSMDGRFRIGYLVDSSFGETRRWHLRAGGRIGLPAIGERFVPFLLAEAETGDVSNESVAVGAALSRRSEIRIEYRDDDQLFGRDQDAVLLIARYAL